MFADRVAELIDIRVHRPETIAVRAAERVKADALVPPSGKLVMVAADHPARGALRAGSRALAMADRADLLERLCVALSRPGVDGVLGTADILEDLLLLGALEGKVVIGSMNRGGLAGTVFEIDDKFTGYDAATPVTMRACADAVNELADRKLMAMVEPFISHRVDGHVRNDLNPEPMTRAITVASGLGRTSAYTWLKVPVVDNMEQVMAASTLPALLLGGEVPSNPDAAFASWQKALRLPTVKGIIAGRSLLYPSDDDVAGAVDTAVGLL
jgi:uncharacterized protein